MFGLARLLKLARTMPKEKRGEREKGRSKTRLHVEELEVRVVPTLMGQQLFPADNPWNQNISNAPLAANSAAIIANIGSSITIHPDWGSDSASNGNDPLYGIPFNIVHGNSTAKVNVIIDNYPGESDIVPVPIPAGAVIEGDFQNGPNTNGGGYNSGQRGDSHLIVWDEDTNIAYELYGVTRPSDKTLFPNTDGAELAHTDNQWHAAQETVWNMNTDTFRTIGDTSADAAGLSILAGLVRPDEGLTVAQGGQGAIDHALRVTLPGGDVNPQYIYPASHMVDESQGADNLPLGGRLRLANTPAIDTLISNMPPESQIIAHAMQQYGLIVADIGSPMFVTGASATVDNVDSPKTDLVWNMDDIFASNGLEALTAGDFQVVNLTPVVTGLSATSGAAGTTITINGQNFSGAAGQLSVLFGSTPSPSVTYVSDTQITAVVPSGSGIVNVFVQSGQDETDTNSDNPNANVTAPIFGYGISAANSAAKFTFSSQSTSAANSTDSFASSTVVSGSTDTVTIVVKDTTGAAVSGLSSSAFSFNLTGGGSSGTFGTVTETATPGTYGATFTGTTAGSVSSLSVTVNGIILNTKPTITVSVGAISGANSTAGFALPTVASGNLDTVTIVVDDGASDPITGLASSAFGLALSGGTSAGTFGTVTATATSGTYMATFTGTTAGTTSTLTVTVNGVIITTKPMVQVTAGGIGGTNSTVSFATATVAAGGTDLVTIAVKDTAGNPVSGLASSAFFFSLAGGSLGTFGTVTETGTKGTYTATFTATTAGTTSTLTTTVSGVTLATAPTVQVTAGAISGANSTVSFATGTVAAGGTDLVTVAVKDTAGNPVSGLASSSFAWSLSGGSAGTFGAVTETATAGTYTTTFTGTTAGTTSTLTATVGGVTLATKPTVEVTAGGVSGTKSTVTFASGTVVAGGADVVTIAVKDTAGNVVGGLPSGAFVFSLAGGSAGTFGTVTQTSTKGTYTVTFTATTAGTASTLTTTVSGVTLAAEPTVQVKTGAVNGAKSTVSFAAGIVASGNTDVVTVSVMDAAGNPVSGLANSAFAFSLAGAGTGTFGTVTETATKGTYTATFTGKTAGTVSTLTTKVSGVTLTAKPTVQVTAGTVSATNSTVKFAAANIAAGSMDTVTIVVKDAAGNAISGLSSSAFGFVLSVGGTGGTFGAVTETSTKGTYNVTFTGTTVGTTSTLAATVNDVTLSARPTVEVTARTASSTSSTAHFAATMIGSGGTDTLTIVVKNAPGDPITGLTSADFVFTLSKGTSAGTFGTVVETTTKGTYTVVFTGTTVGTTSTLTVSIDGVTLSTKPTIMVGGFGGLPR